MEYSNNILRKGEGQRTPISQINIKVLNSLIDVFEKEINVKDASKIFQLWVNSNFDSQHTVNLLYSIIVTFGEGYRIWGRFNSYYNDNLENINATLIRAYNIKNDGIAPFLKEIQTIRGLGGLSYSTKMARFFNNEFVVLDSILREELGINENQYNYFLEVCSQIKIDLIAKYDVQRSNSQIESGIFTWIQIINPNQRRKRWSQYANQFNFN